MAVLGELHVVIRGGEGETDGGEVLWQCYGTAKAGQGSAMAQLLQGYGHRKPVNTEGRCGCWTWN